MVNVRQNPLAVLVEPFLALLQTRWGVPVRGILSRRGN